MEPSNTSPKLELVKPGDVAETAPLPAEVAGRAGRRLAHATDSAKVLGALVAGGCAAELVLGVLRALGMVP